MASTTCTNCRGVVPAGAFKCPSCGHEVASSGTKFNAASLTQTDRIIGIATLVLVISLLFLPWFSLDGLTGGALSAHGYLYLTLFVSIGILSLIGGHAFGIIKSPEGSSVSRDQMLMVGTAVNFVFVLLGFILKPGGLPGFSVGWSYGAFIGLVAAVVAALPLGLPIIQARRRK
jgi:hypothetical protein